MVVVMSSSPVSAKTTDKLKLYVCFGLIFHLFLVIRLRLRHQHRLVRVRMVHGLDYQDHRCNTIQPLYFVFFGSSFIYFNFLCLAFGSFLV